MSIKRNIVSKFCALASKRVYDTCRVVFERPFERRVGNKVSSPRNTAAVSVRSNYAGLVLLLSFAFGAAHDVEAEYVRGGNGMGDGAMTANDFGHYSVTRTASGTGSTWMKFTQTTGWDPQWGSGSGGFSATINSSTGNARIGSQGGSGDLSISTTSGRSYTFRLKGESNWWDRTFVIMETTSAPVTISSVTNDSSSKRDNAGVVVSITTSTSLSAQEKIFVVYTSNSWTSRSNVEATGSGTSYSATIPGVAQGTRVDFYVVTTTVPNTTLDDDYDLWTLRGNNNSGSNYNYTLAASVAPSVTSSAATSITTTGATLNGNVTSDGGATVTERGFYYKTSASVTTSDTKVTAAGTTGAYTAAPTLSVNTRYYFKAFATNTRGTTLSSTEQNFWTLANTPSAPTVNGATTSSLNVAINENGNPASTEFSIRVGASQYVQANGSLNTTEVWQTKANWGTKTVTGLAAGTSYSFVVRARNGASTTTSDSAATAVSTTAASASISSSGTPAALSTTYGTASSSTSFSISGSNMAEGILVTPPSGFQVSTDNSTFSSTVTIGAAGTISSTTIYVRLASTAVPGSYSGNIVLSSSGATSVNVATTSSTVNTKALTISSAAVTSKVYDRTATATITGSLSGVVGSDVVTLSGTGTFASAAVGTGKAVTSTSTLGGANASYYTLTQPTGLTGDITAAPLTITGASATNKTYDRTTTIAVTGGSLSGVISGDTVTLSAASAAGTVASAAVGTGKAVTVTGYSIGGADSGNYSLSQPSLTVDITAKALTVTGATATNRAYNGSTTVAVSGGSPSGVISGDTVTLGGTPTGTVATATVGAGKAVTVTGYTISGTDSGNYSLTQPSLTVDITKATPTVLSSPTASSIKYAQALSASTLSGGITSPSGGTWAWTTPATIPPPGLSSQSVTYTPTDTTNYDQVTRTINITSQIAQARNTAGAATPTQPSALYLGDTNKTFGADTWGTIDGAYGRGRLFIRYNNTAVSGGTASAWTSFVNTDSKSMGSPQFTNTGTWNWGIQMDYGATYGTNFWYKSSSSGWTDMSTNGLDATLSVTVSALPQPTTVAANPSSATAVDLTWARATGSGNTWDTIVVRHSSSSITDPTQGTSYSTSGSTGGGTVVYKGDGTSFSDTGLTKGTTYYYKVYAENWNYYSDGVAVSAVPSTVPGAPTGVSITPGNTSLSVAFTAPADNGGTAITDYEYSTDGGLTFKSAAATSSPINITTVSGSSSALVNGTTYNVQLRAVNARGTGSATASSTGIPRTIPGAPTITGITPSSGQLSVAFTAPSSDGGSAITSYKYSTDGGSTWRTRAAGTTASPLIITTLSTNGTTALSNGTSYDVQIRAVNAAGDGTATATTAATPYTTPGAPTITGITPSSGQLSVAFTTPSSDGGSAITSYKYSTDGGSTWLERATGTTASPLVITTLSSDGTTALSNGTSYNVQIRAVNVAGDGTATASTAATPYTTPGAPTIDSITAGDTQLAVNFTAGATGGSAITNYEYSTDGGSTWSTRSPVSTASPLTIEGLTNGVQYSVQIRAVNAAGTGTATATTTGTPVAATPTISSSGTPGALSTTYGTASASTSFTVSGVNMEAGILVTPPSGFQVSTNDSTFSSTVTVGSSGTISSTTVYVRLSASTAAGTKSGNIVLSSSGAANVNVATTSSTVSAKALTISDAAVTTKTYDGTDSAAITGTLAGVVGSDTVTLTGTGTFASANAGTGISVTSTSTLGGADSANYSLTQPTGLTGTITAKALTISGAAATNRAYNGTTTVAVSGGSLAGVESGDTVTLDAASATGTVATAAIGTGKSVTVTGYALGGADAGNYSVTQPTDVTVDITAKALTISGATATNRDYDGTTTAAVSGGSLVGVETGDTVTLDAASATGTVATATVGSGKSVTVTGYALDGADAGNYSVTQPTGITVDISKATPAISTPPTASAIYFGQAISNSTLSGGAATGAGGGALAGAFAWTSGATVHAAGTTSYSVTFSPTDTTNYNTATAMVTLPTSMPQARNSGTAGAPQKPASLFLGDDGTFGLDSWGAIVSNWGQARLWVRFNNSDLTGGTATTYSAFLNQDNKTRTSPRFSQVGTWYWGFQMNYSSPYGNDYWYKASLADWTAMSSSGTDATLTVEVSALNDPSGVTATAGSSTSIDLAWTRGTSGNAKDTVIVRREGSAVATDPTQGTAYSASDTLGTGTVVYRGSGTTFSDTGLTPGATYHYKLYAENWSYYSAGVIASASTPGTPSITVDGSTSATTTAFSTTYGTASAVQSFAIVGSSLTANITATAPSGFEVSSDGTTYGSTAIFTQTSGSASGTLRIRLAATATAGNYNSAVIALTSTGATTRNITTPATGNTVSKVTPTITANPTVSASIIKGDALSNNLLSGGTASTAGTFAFDDTSSEQTTSGSKAVTFTPTDASNFNTVATTVNVTVDPVPDPTNVTATSSGTTSIALTHDLTSSKNVMIVRRAGSAVTFTPTDNTNYNNGQNVGDGHVVLHGSLAANTSSDTGLDPSTTYHYRIFSENWGWYSAGVATSATTDALPPTITVTGSPGAMTTNYGTASAAENFTVSGTNLSASLSVAAPAGFEVSESSGSGYGSAVTLTPSSGSVASTTIYVRLKSNASPGANSGDITVASTGATSETVAVSGTVNVASMSMTINSPAGSMNADYTTSKLFADELAGTTNNVTITFSPGLTPDEVEVWTNLNNRERADDDANSDGIPDGIIPPDPPTDKPVGYTTGVYPTDGYFQAHPMSGSAGTYTLTINANKTGAYRLTARYRMNGGPWVYYNYGGKRDHAITVTPILARNMNVYEVNVLNINATGDTFQTRSTFEDLTDTNSTRVNLDYLRNMGVNTLWFQPIHPNGVEGREPSGGWDTATSPYDPGSPYAVKNFFEVMEIMTDSYNGGSSVAANRASAMAAFTNFVAEADTKGVHVMLDAPFNHTAHDVELGPQGLELLAAAGVSTNGWSATDKIKDREARFFSRNDGANAYAGPASSAANIAAAPDRNDFGKWRDVLDVFFGRYSALVEGNPSSGAALNKFKNESDAMEYGDLTGGANSAGAVTRAVWEYFARYVPYWLEQTGLPAGSSAAEQAYKGVDGLRADFGQGMPPQFWEYVINVAREHKWNFVFMSESLDGGEVTYRSNRHFDILNENIVFPWQQAGNTTAHRSIFEDRRAAYGNGLVLLNNTSHDEAGYADPWQAFIRYAVGSTVDGAPMIMYGQEIGTADAGSFSHYEVNFGKSIPHFKRYNSMNPQWLAWGNNTLGVRNLMPNYSGVGLAREFSAALRSSNRWFLNPINTSTADPDIFAVAKYETANASPSNSDVVLAFVNLNRNSAEANTFGIPAGLGTLLGIEANKYYNVKNIAAYLGPNNELNGRRDNFLWESPRLGSDILANGIYVAMNPVPDNDAAWSTAPYEVQYLKVYAAPSISVSGSPSAVSSTYGSVSANTSFTLSGSDVHDGMTVTAPSGFQVSTNASTGFASSITLTDTGTVGSTTIYVRLADNNAVGSYSGNVTISSPGGNSTTVAVPSSTVNQKALAVTGATASNRVYDGTTSIAVSGGSLVGVVGGDEVTLSTGSASGTVATATAGAGKAVTVTGYTIGGGAVANYTLTQPTDVTVTISKATPTITAAPTAGAIAEGQALSNATLSGGTVTGVDGGSLAGSFAFTSSGTIPAAGTASHSVTFTPTDSTNYNSTTAMVSVNAGLAADFSVDFVDGAYVIKDGGGTPLAGVTYTYSYSGRSVGGLTQAYSFISYSSSTAPTAPGYYTVEVTAAGDYIGALSEPFAIAGPLALPNGQAIEVTKTAGVTTVRFNRATLLGNLQRVVNDADGTLATGATGLTWTATTAGLSQMPMGYDPATMPNTVTYSSSFVTLTPPGGGASTSDSFTLTVSDGVTPVSYPVTVTSTAAPAFDLQIRKLVPIDGDPTNMKAIFLTRPNRTVELEFFSTTDGEFVPVRDKDTVVSADTQNSLTTMHEGNAVQRPPDQISTGASGVLELKVPAAHSSMSFRAKPVTAQ